MKFYGLGLDSQSRCLHYHTELDIVSLKCQACQRYYACYQCHDSMEDHHFRASLPTEIYPVLCGVCEKLLTKDQYEQGACPYCTSPFNPKCKLHALIYFSKESLEDEIN
ncbi:CHY zinc finger protein [Streptococcus caprae]|uniref:CHY zinc finger protein n=1 Tax=Streptococcus caprae TaxID=1640501 RepID=A0ABV8CV20_9STRE